MISWPILPYDQPNRSFQTKVSYLSGITGKEVIEWEKLNLEFDPYANMSPVLIFLRDAPSLTQAIRKHQGSSAYNQ